MILTTLLIASLLARSPAPAQDTSEATAEGAEILRRILAQALNDALPHDEGKVPGRTLSFGREGVDSLVTELWAGEQSVGHSRVFHLPGAGLFFALDVEVPVIAKEAPAEPQKEESTGKDDEWERMKRQVRGGPSSDASTVPSGRLRLFHRWSDEAQPRDVELDKDAIRKLEDAVLKTLARHAARVEGLSPQDSITVALQLSGDNGQFLWSGRFPGTVTIRPEVAADDGEEDEPQELATTYALNYARQAPEQHLVIRIALADLAGVDGGGLERLRQRARINRY